MLVSVFEFDQVHQSMKKNIFISILLFILFSPLSQGTEVYVSDAGNFSQPPWQILKFDENGENPEVFIKDNLDWPQDIVFLEDTNTVLISNFGSGRITRHNAETGAYIDNFATSIAAPTRMKIGADNLLYVLQWNGNGKVRRYQLNGTFVDEFKVLLASIPAESIYDGYSKDRTKYTFSSEQVRGSIALIPQTIEFKADDEGNEINTIGSVNYSDQYYKDDLEFPV